VVEEGIFNHPVVVISRPVEEFETVHFHIITSFGGKKLHEMYGKANDFHQSRRSWYLPISPTPPHPDATSKKAKKRFPTLELADNGLLRWDSYVNMRDVYKVDWSCLRHYANPDTPFTQDYSFQRESLLRLLAKGKQLTGYYPSHDQARQKIRSYSPDIQESPVPPVSPESSVGWPPSPPLQWDTASKSPHGYPEFPSPARQPFLGRRHGQYGIISIPEEESQPPDDESKPKRLGIIRRMIAYILGWPLFIIRRLWARLWKNGHS
jgi:hypothetical protein